MRCPACQKRDNHVVKTREAKTLEDDDFIKRRRECDRCGHRFSTYECYELADCEAAFELAELRSTLDGLLHPSQ